MRVRRRRKRRRKGRGGDGGASPFHMPWHFKNKRFKGSKFIKSRKRGRGGKRGRIAAYFLCGVGEREQFAVAAGVIGASRHQDLELAVHV